MGRKKTTFSVFQAHLPFKSRLPERTATVSLAFEKHALFALGGLLIALAFIYSYFIMMSVSHVVARENVQYEAEQLSGNVARLEQQYLAASVHITESAALASGFERTSKQVFVERVSSGVAQATR